MVPQTIPQEEFYGLFNKSKSLCVEPETGECRPAITHETLAISGLHALREFVFHLAKPGAVSFSSDETGKLIHSGMSYMKIMAMFRRALELSEFTESKVICPEVDFLIKALEEVRFDLALLNKSSDGEQLARILNSVRDQVITYLKSEAYNKRRKLHLRGVNKNLASLKNFLNDMLKSHARLVVVRVDLSYQAGVIVDFERAKSDRERLLRNMRHKPSIFGSLLGYVIKLEYGKYKGFHFHCAFFFDGARCREDISLGRMIGEYWEQPITHGQGIYYNCNRYKDQYANCGIGVVNYHDLVKITALHKTLEYIAKLDKYIKFVAPDGAKLLTKSTVKPKTVLGRPRQYQIDDVLQQST